MQWEDGGKFIGKYENGKREGFGKFFYKNNCVYTGFYKNDVRWGKGKLICKDGSNMNGIIKYTGLFKGNWMHGYGEGHF